MKKWQFFLALALISSIVFAVFMFTKNSNKVDAPASEVAEITPYSDILKYDKINITNSYNLNQEFTVKYKAYDPEGYGTAQFKAKSFKEIATAGKKTPDDGKKLILVEIAVRGNKNNIGSPSTFNLLGVTPSPQFVLVDKKNDISLAEATYFSDGYTEEKKLPQLSNITLDHEQWVDTVIVFQIEKQLEPDLMFRFTNTNGQTEFYDIK